MPAKNLLNRFEQPDYYPDNELKKDTFVFSD